MAKHGKKVKILKKPFKEWTKAEANAIPVINDPDAMYIMKTDGQAWEEGEDTEKTDEE